VIARSTRLILTADVTILLSNIVSSLIGARALGPAGRGDLLIVVLWPPVVAMMASFGLPAAYRYWMAREPQRVSRLFSNAVLYTIAIGIVSVVLADQIVPSLVGERSPEVMTLLRIYQINIPAALFLELMRSLLEGTKRFGWAGAARMIFFGVQAVGFTTVRPLQGGWDFNMEVELAGHPKLQRTALTNAQARATSDDYFKTMGIRLLQGRFFTTTDAPAAQPVAIVNRAFVKRFFANENPLGQQMRFNDKGPRQWSTIVGVVDDSPQKTIGQPPLPEIHYNLNQLLPQDDLYPILGTFYMNVAIRSPLSSETISHELRRAVHDLQPEAALNNVQTMQDVVDGSLGNQVLAARLLGLFALAGLVIAIAGIYGLLAYSVSQRTRELGVRLALGAQRNAVLWLVLRHALILLGIGVTLGAVITAASGKLLTAFLPYKLSGYDGLVALSVAMLLTLCGLAASYLPARRAAHIDPVVALRTE